MGEKKNEFKKEGSWRVVLRKREKRQRPSNRPTVCGHIGFYPTQYMVHYYYTYIPFYSSFIEARSFTFFTPIYTYICIRTRTYDVGAQGSRRTTDSVDGCWSGSGETKIHRGARHFIILRSTEKDFFLRFLFVSHPFCLVHLSDTLLRLSHSPTIFFAILCAPISGYIFVVELFVAVRRRCSTLRIRNCWCRLKKFVTSENVLHIPSTMKLRCTKNVGSALRWRAYCVLSQNFLVRLFFPLFFFRLSTNFRGREAIFPSVLNPVA